MQKRLTGPSILSREGLPSRTRIGSLAETFKAAGLEAVVRIELPGPAAEQALAEHAAAGGGTEVDYAVDVWWRRF